MYICTQMKQVRPKKNLGQHFLTDLNIASAIADTVDACPDIPVLEVGPGMGVLTQFLMQKPRPLSVVEIDRESVAYLTERYPFFSRKEEGRRTKEITSEIQNSKDSVEATCTQCISPSSLLLPPSSKEDSSSNEESPRLLLEGDFLRMDLHQLFDGKPFVLTGNYPYDISSQIFFKVIDNKDLIPCCTGMIQREVAQRMEAKPGTKAYGILSVLIQAWYDVEYLFTVDENVFDPPPKVKSAVIRMTRNKVQDLGCDEKLFRRVVKTVFNQRRKMLRVSLRQLFTKDTMPDSSFFSQDIMTMRPEQLTIPQFVELTNQVETISVARWYGGTVVRE